LTSRASASSAEQSTQRAGASAREGRVGVPDDQGHLPVAVCRHDQRLREHAADQRLQAAQPVLAVGCQHDQRVDAARDHCATHPRQPLRHLLECKRRFGDRRDHRP
jgi:hypothetical protein